ncbi:uncharacterized protein AMSG_05204 [Thecamonas trahens ATCC 50062]|uniref:Uncharacterized protein n=1 Tax=Thecamonas trahens ATCC 50062 TaxID=461836 RepID=A0A0L0DD15_THETB|nr:hypothetical protein AMSG_05204 [Thecamonas trahens ATCC 50062]KNC49218.1 hypothetical protein AMSG_05204 [Thecamonas trahens ATCC 50062]|eukprot:XP_013757938.1 hypothetical protein AMSG_05204 [Thecamonas trahens ATCC 50062]
MAINPNQVRSEQKTLHAAASVETASATAGSVTDDVELANSEVPAAGHLQQNLAAGCEGSAIKHDHKTPKSREQPTSADTRLGSKRHIGEAVEKMFAQEAKAYHDRNRAKASSVAIPNHSG